MMKKNEVTPTRLEASAGKRGSGEEHAGATLSLMVIGIGSIVFGCGDLVAGFMAFSFLWSWAWLFSYAWGGFLFAVISGSLVLKAATTKPRGHWTSVAFGFGLAALILHIVDFAIAIASVATLSNEGEKLFRNETELKYTGKPSSKVYYNYYYYQSPLVAEAPRLVIVSVLLALDIWLLVLTSKLRGAPQDRKTCSILLASGAFNLVYGVGQLVAGLFSVLEWNSRLSYLRWISCGFTGVAFLFAMVNGLLLLRAANHKPNDGNFWSHVAFTVGILALVVYVVAMGPCLYSIVVTGSIGPTLYKEVDGGVTAGQYDVYYNTYETALTPAVPEAARLVTLAVLSALTLVQICIASKLRKQPLALATIALQRSVQFPSESLPVYDTSPPSYSK